MTTFSSQGSPKCECIVTVAYHRGHPGKPGLPTSMMTAIGPASPEQIAAHVGESIVPDTIEVPADYETVPNWAGVSLNLVGLFWLFSDEVGAIYGGGPEPEFYPARPQLSVFDPNA